jgi:hypothetical protein
MGFTRGWTAAFLAGVTLAACGDDLGPTTELSSLDLITIALDADIVTGAILNDQIHVIGTLFGDGAALTVNAGDVRTVSRSRECPGGGNVEVSGSVERTRVGDNAFEFAFNSTGAQNECVHLRGERSVTITGHFTMTASWRREAGQPSGVQNTHRFGSFTWTRGNGATGTCEFDITSVRDPRNHTRTVTGTMCGREINRSTRWTTG